MIPVSLLFAAALAAAPADSLTARELLDVRTVQAQALAPDGRWVVATRSARRDQLGFVAARDGDPTYARATPAELLLVDTRTGAERPLLPGRVTARGAVFAPDGGRVAVAVLEAADVWGLRVVEVGGGTVTPIRLPAGTLLDGTAPLVWSADGRTLWVATRTVAWRDSARARFATLVRGPVTALGAPADEPFLPWEGLRREAQRRAVVAVELAAQRVTPVLPAGLIATATPAPDGGALSWTEDMAAKTDYDVIMGREDRLLARRTGDSTRVLFPSVKGVTVRWAEDGRRYFYGRDGALWMGTIPAPGQAVEATRRRLAAPDSAAPGDTSRTARDRRARTRLTLLRVADAGDAVLAQDAAALWLVDTAGARTRIATLPDSTDAASPRPTVLEWSRDGRWVYLALNARDRYDRAVARWDRQTGELRTLVRDGRLRSGVQLSRDGSTLLWNQAEPNRPADLWVADAAMAQPRRLLEANAWLTEGRVARTELFRYVDTDGAPQWGVLFHPMGVPAGPAPTVFIPYEDFFDDGYDAMANFLASRGYAVVKPSVSFETGFPGEAWAKGVTAAANALVARGVADSARLGVHGTSYGGYATNLLITQTKRFKAAINISGKVDIISFYTDSPRLGNRNTHAAEKSQDRLGATLWQQPQKYWAHSAVLYADRIETPLLLMTGGEDHNVPAQNTREMYYALRRLGKPVVWVNYANGGHGIPMTTEAEFTDWHQRIAGWYARYLRPAPR
jgi:dipeptidyl aminopeptidase/acylaminoacyl peptidase